MKLPGLFGWLRTNYPYYTIHKDSFNISFMMKPLPGWLSGERVRLVTWWLWVCDLVEANFLSGVFLPLTSAEACEKSCWWL